jgi:hypothetical protein
MEPFGFRIILRDPRANYVHRGGKVLHQRAKKLNARLRDRAFNDKTERRFFAQYWSRLWHGRLGDLSAVLKLFDSHQNVNQGAERRGPLEWRQHPCEERSDHYFHAALSKTSTVVFS